MKDQDDFGIPVIRDRYGNDVNEGLRLETKLAMGAVVLCIFLVVLIAASNSGGGGGESVHRAGDDAPSGGIIFFGIILFAVIGIPISLYFKEQSNENIRRVYSERDKEERRSARALEEVRRMTEQSSQKLSDLQAREIGDTIIAGPGAYIVNKSLLINSLNRISSGNENLGNALKEVAGCIENSKNAEAAQIFNEFNKKIEAGEGRFTLKGLWQLLVKTLPEVVQVGNAAGQIATFIESL